MGILRTTIFGRIKYKPNTFIGGIAKLGGTGVNAPINTRALLASKLSISESRIRVFKVNGDNVEFYIKDAYAITGFGGTNAVDANQNITYYYDNDGKVNSLNYYCFRHCGNFIDFKFSSALNYIGNSAFSYTKITNANMSYLNALGQGNNPTNGEWLNMMQFCTELVSVDLGNLGTTSTQSGETFRGCTKLESATLKIPYYGQTFRDAGQIGASFYNEYCLQAGAFSFLNSRFENIQLPNCTSFLNGAFYRASTPKYTKTVIAPKVTSISKDADGIFRGQNILELVDIRACKYFYGRTAGDSGTYNFRDACKSGTVVKVHEFMGTSYSGEAEPELTYIKGRGAIVEFYDDAGNYVSTL